MNSQYWTFRVPGSDSLVATPRDSEGFLLLNPTAAWIWENRDLSDIAPMYADHFHISLQQAEADIRQVLSPGEKIQTKINDVGFEIYLDGDSLADEIVPRLGAAETSLSQPPNHIFELRQTPHAVLIYLDGHHLATESLVTSARARLLQELTRLAEPDRAFTTILHAGAIGTSKAAAILAGPSFSGKSTLCAALLESGLLCLGDDSACLTPNFHLAGMPFALSLREGAWPLFPHLDRPRFLPSNLNGTSPLVPATRLLFVNYDPAATSTTLDHVSTFDALVALNESGFWIEHTQMGITRFLDWLATIPIHRLTYSSLSDAVSSVKSLL